MNLLLCMLALVGTAADESPSLVQAKRAADTLELSLPTLAINEHYNVQAPVWSAEATRFEWLSPGSLRIWTKAAEGTVEVAVCGPGYCRVKVIRFVGTPFEPTREPWDIPWETILAWGMIGGLMGLLGLYTIKIAVGARCPWKLW